MRTTASPSYYDQGSSMDQMIAPGLRLWMLLAMIFGILLFMVIIVCCFMKIRIPRTKREIELMAAKRKFRRQRHTLARAEEEGMLTLRSKEHISKVIVMQSLGVPARLSQMDAPTPSDAECISCADAESCGTCESPHHTHPSSLRHSKESLDVHKTTNDTTV